MTRENTMDETRKRRFFEKPARKRYKEKRRAKYIQKINSEFMPTTTFGFNNGYKSFYISDNKYIENKINF